MYSPSSDSEKEGVAAETETTETVLWDRKVDGGFPGMFSFYFTHLPFGSDVCVCVLINVRRGETSQISSAEYYRPLARSGTYGSCVEGCQCAYTGAWSWPWPWPWPGECSGWSGPEERGLPGVPMIHICIYVPLEYVDVDRDTMVTT